MEFFSIWILFLDVSERSTIKRHCVHLHFYNHKCLFFTTVPCYKECHWRNFQSFASYVLVGLQSLFFHSTYEMCIQCKTAPVKKLFRELALWFDHVQSFTLSLQSFKIWSNHPMDEAVINLAHLCKRKSNFISCSKCVVFKTKICQKNLMEWKMFRNMPHIWQPKTDQNRPMLNYFITLQTEKTQIHEKPIGWAMPNWTKYWKNNSDWICIKWLSNFNLNYTCIISENSWKTDPI